MKLNVPFCCRYTLNSFTVSVEWIGYKEERGMYCDEEAFLAHCPNAGKRSVLSIMNLHYSLLFPHIYLCLHYECASGW